MASALTFLLLVLSVVHVESKVNFHFSGFFYCPFEEFRYHLTLIENDPTFPDAISHEAGMFSHAPHPWKADGVDTDDGALCIPGTDLCVFTNYTFEITLRIIHNCTPDGKNKKYDFYLGEYYKQNGDVYNSFNIHLYDAGDPTTDVIGTMKKKMKNQRDV
ncbi:hypothetical protein CAEBREN_00610 [Caenorhabditis brenneri]|uniref:Uncharacterized protein n=1 Tax=Caenorhabditis brenneri TaxID=135651 RepID=G0P0F6_CAEBE|nr:hypothetical protein CAEBREN_00610 [Caenorhabditis brenneri]